MTVEAKILAAGKLGTALASLYQVPAGSAVRVTQAHYANNSTANDYTVELMIQPLSIADTNTYRWLGAGTLLLAKGRLDAVGNGLSLMLASTDRLWGSASGVLDYVITGIEEVP